MEKRAINYKYIAEILAPRFNISQASATQYVYAILRGNKIRQSVSDEFKNAVISEIEVQAKNEISKFEKL
jgi:hypothetical protein